MNELVKQEEDKIALIEYIPTVEDLEKIFRDIQPCDKVPDNEVRCLVQAVPKVTMHQRGSGLWIHGQPEEAKTIAYITLKKFRDGDKDIWLYTGKVKA